VAYENNIKIKAKFSLKYCCFLFISRNICFYVFTSIIFLQKKTVCRRTLTSLQAGAPVPEVVDPLPSEASIEQVQMFFLVINKGELVLC